MAVGSFLKSSGIAALAIGLAIALPAAASAQERSWGNRGDGGQQAQQGGGQHNGGGWRGGGEGRGGGNREFRPQQAPQVQAPAQPQTQPQAQAQPRWQGNGNRWGNGGTPNGGGAPSWRRDNPQAGQQLAPRQGWNGQPRGEAPPRPDVQRNWNGNGNRWQDNQANRARPNNLWQGDNRGRNWNDGNRWRDNNRGWNGNRGGQWNNNWRRDTRYNWSSYRNTHRDVFRMGRYYSPYNNWSYRRLGIGFMLEPLFYGSNYWIDDPWQYRLPEAYGPYRWVRYYDDALLVDTYSGEVVDVIYDFFW